MSMADTGPAPLVKADLDAGASSVALAFLRHLKHRGVNRFIVNAGTDFAPILEAYASASVDECGALPQIVVAGHENLAIGMAHGAFLMSGTAQAVMFHVNVGTANAVCGAINAAHERVPILLCAGRSPLFEHGCLGARNTRVSWTQEMYDQAAMVREYVKWDYELRGPLQLESVVDRALAFAQSEPKGPVYLTLPREVLAESAASNTGVADAGAVGASRAAPSPDAVAVLADKLVKADFPLISSLAAGADVRVPALLGDICDRFGIGYVEEQARYQNLASDHPLNFGHGFGGVIERSDVLCFIEADVPWIPELKAPSDEAFIVHAGADPLFSRFPIRTHRSDLSITADPFLFLSALNEALTAHQRQIEPGRRERMIAAATASRTARIEAARREGEALDGPISNGFLSAALGELLDDTCVVFNEYWLSREAVRLNQPGRYFYLPSAGGLGWGLPAALGAKMEAPEATVIAAVGDGSYLFANPAACHHASEKHGLPVLTVICNNSRWNAVNSTARLVYPQGEVSKQQSFPLSDLSPAPAYEEYVRASGGFGVRVSERAQLRQALQQALRAVRVEGRQALVNVICA